MCFCWGAARGPHDSSEKTTMLDVASYPPACAWYSDPWTLRLTTLDCQKPIVMATQRATHLEFLAKALAIDLSGEALVVESAQLAVIVDLQLLLRPRGGVRNVQLHGAGPGEGEVGKGGRLTDLAFLSTEAHDGSDELLQCDWA